MEQFVQSRLAALKIVERVITGEKTLLNIFDGVDLYDSLHESADKHFCRLLVYTVLRRYGQINALINSFVEKPLPEKRLKTQLILCLGVAQIFYLKTPAYAAVDVCVRLSRLLKQHAFSGFINAVLRNMARRSAEIKEPCVLLNLPTWLKESWRGIYSDAEIERFAQVFASEAPLDISVKENPSFWAKQLNGEVLLPTGSVRCTAGGDITKLAGYEAGAWWVQEASASIPAQLFPDLSGLHIADLCAAPGGKTAQLAVKGARVDAFDISENRLKRLRENMERLGLTDKVRVSRCDASELIGAGLYDGVLLDAPCSATGTIRRHPDLLFHRTQNDVARLAQTQRKLLQKAVHLTKPQGYIVYATCSMQFEENEKVVESVLSRNQNVSRAPIADKWQPFLNEKGAIQVLPDKNQDGFYAVLLKKA